MKLVIVVIFLLNYYLSWSQIILIDSTYVKIENKLFVNDQNVKLSGNFYVKITDDVGFQYLTPIINNTVDIENLYKKQSDVYIIELYYDEYVLQVKLYSTQVLLNDNTIWNWIIFRDLIKMQCCLRIDCIDSEIEYRFPVKCVNK